MHFLETIIESEFSRAAQDDEHPKVHDPKKYYGFFSYIIL
jgi:hypothetical protein